MAKEEGPNRMTCALLAIIPGFFGLQGIHRFVLGDPMGGVIRFVLCCVPISLVEGIIYLTKTDEEFYQTYVVEKKAWF
jgi:TM2 domain-containing membrane protein YozV